MSKLKIKLNSKGVKELLKSEDITQTCIEQAEAVRQRAGDGYAMERRTYPERTGCIVYTDSVKAMTENLKNNTLLKALSI